MLTLARLTPARAAVLVLALGLVQCGVVDEFTQPTALGIQRFVATPAEVTAGNLVTLTWEVKGADSVEIDNGIGTVAASGSRQVHPAATTLYSLLAKAGTSAATATVQVTVQGTPSPSPSPSPTPSPSPSPSPTPTPTPSPSPSPSPTPVPSPTPTPVTCGAPATAAGNCTVTMVRPTALGAGECVEVNAVTVNQSCPVGFNTSRSIAFAVTAHTARTGLGWRRSVTSSDVVSPSSGSLSSNGSTSVLVNDIVLDSAVTIEIVDGTQVLLAFTLRHY